MISSAAGWKPSSSVATAAVAAKSDAPAAGAKIQLAAAAATAAALGRLAPPRKWASHSATAASPPVARSLAGRRNLCASSFNYALAESAPEPKQNRSFARWRQVKVNGRKHPIIIIGRSHCARWLLFVCLLLAR